MKINKLFPVLLLGLFCSLGVFAQDDDKFDDETFKRIVNEACNCTAEIDSAQPKDSIVSHINSCITTQIVIEQTKETLGTPDEIVDQLNGMELTENDTIVELGPKSENIIIYIDKDFDRIQAELFETCERVKTLLILRNDERDYSMSKNEKAIEYYRKGERAYLDGEYEKAVYNFEKALKEDAKFAFAWDNLGVTYRKMGEYKKAIECYEESLKVDPDGRMPLQNIAVAYGYLENHKKAIETYDKYIEKYPDDPEGYYGNGRENYFEGNYAEGVDNMFKAYVLYKQAQSPYANDAQTMLGAMYSDLEEKGKLDIFKEAAKNNNVQIE